MYRIALSAFGAIFVVLGAASPSSALDLHLRCDGVATYPEMQSTSASVHGDVSLNASSTTVVAGRVQDRMLLEVTDGGARVRLPRAMIPPINSGGNDGWWQLADLTVGDTEIGGRFRLNPFNKPTVRVDRVTGAIEVQGSFKLSFRGTCSVADPVERRF